MTLIFRRFGKLWLPSSIILMKATVRNQITSDSHSIHAFLLSVLHDAAVPDLPVLLQQGNEAIIALAKGSVSLLDHFDILRSCMFIGKLNEIADIEMPRRTVKREVNITQEWHQSYVRYLQC